MMSLLQVSVYTVVMMLFFCQPVPAQQLMSVSPEQAGFSSERLQKITEMMDSYTEDHQVAGIVAIVARDGKILYHTASGYRDIEAEIPMQKDDIYRIASQTKSVTSTAAMMLYEEGKLLLDDPVSKYIPEFRNPEILKSFNKEDSTFTTESANREVTIHDLLTHTSGISYPVIGPEEAKAIYAKAGVPLGFEPRPVKLEDKMKALGALPLLHHPGERYTYGLSTDVLGFLVEVISETSLNNFFRERIFEPLDMKDTYFYVPTHKHSRLATVYSYNSVFETVVRPDDPNIDHTYPLVDNGTYYSGGAGLSSTAHDYAKFLQMLLNGGEYNGRRLMSPYTIRLMTVNQISDLGLWGSPNKMGYGFEVVTEKGSTSSPWHEGTYSGGGFWGSGHWVDPSAGIVAVLWTQHSSQSWVDMQNKFRIMIYGALTEE